MDEEEEDDEEDEEEEEVEVPEGENPEERAGRWVGRWVEGRFEVDR